MVDEHVIRDKLVQDLGIIEPGLTVLDKEHHLPNTSGAAGFVDILAKDLIGHLVLIELKRSDSAARTAMHELFKYTALVKQNTRLGPDRVRCIVVSTEWHELLVPFSEFVRLTPFSTTGYRLSIAQDGTPTAAERITPLEGDLPFELCPLYGLFCFSSPDRRAFASMATVSLLRQAGVADFVILETDYGGGSSAVIFPYAMWVIINRVAENHRGELLEQQILPIGSLEDGDHPDWPLEEAIITALNGSEDLQRDDTENGYPEKLAGDMNKGWIVSSIVRSGSLFPDTQVMSDEEVLAICQGIEGGNTVLFTSISSPQYRANWESFCSGIERTLSGNSGWLTCIMRCLRAAAEETPTCRVAAQIYNPLSILRSLKHVATDAEPVAYVPSVDIAIASENGVDLCLLKGELVWDRGVPPASCRQIIEDVYDGTEGYGLHLVLHTEWQEEERAVSMLGMRYRVIELSGILSDEEATVTELVPEGQGVARVDPDVDRWVGIGEFVQANRAFTEELIGLFAGFSNGL